MRIGIDVRPLSIRRTGIGNYILRTLEALSRIDGEDEFFLYSNRDFPLPVISPKWHKRIGSGIACRNGTLWVLTGMSGLPTCDKVDLLWCPMQIIPFNAPCRTLLTIYDFVWKYYPETMSVANLLISRLFISRSIKRADRIACISQATADDLTRIYNRPVGNLDVVYGAAGGCRSQDRDEARGYIGQKYNLSGRYILNVGTVEPRKNLVGLLEAFKVLQERYGTEHRLLLAGASGWRNSDIYRTYNRLGFTEDTVRFLGYIPDEDMPYLYAGADVFVFPSFYEGFGLPPLEAMACGCPVITSNTSSLPEVVGDAGIMVDPHDTEGLAEVIQRVLSDEDMQLRMIAEGIARASHFSWENTARQMAGLFAKVAGA